MTSEKNYTIPALGLYKPMETQRSVISFGAQRDIDTLCHRIARGQERYGTRANKNPHAVALGHMTSPAKKAAAEKNGEKGGRPKGS